MTQEAINVTDTPPLPGLQLVQEINGALRTLATDFSGSDDPSSLTDPYMTWADTATGTLKRRNEANSEWVIIGRLFNNHLPMYPANALPTTDIGPIYIIGQGAAEWQDDSYKALLLQSVGESTTKAMSQKAVTDLFGCVSSDWTDISNKPATATRWPTYTEVTNKPSTFPPSSHTHAWGQITGAPATATRWPAWGEVTGKPSSMPPPTGYGAVGTYVLAYRNGYTTPGNTAAGSSLHPSAASGGRDPTITLSGTWRCMGFSQPGGATSNEGSTTLWVRIS